MVYTIQNGFHLNFNAVQNALLKQEPKCHMFPHWLYKVVCKGLGNHFSVLGVHLCRGKESECHMTPSVVIL